MGNHILDIRVANRSLDPVEAEVRVTVMPARVTPTTEVRGRLMGPTCPYSSTIEVAYPLSPLKRAEQPEPGSLTCRVVIPEASLWDTQSPFLYAGPVELWQDGQPCQRVRVRHGLRRFGLAAQGLRVNGRPMTLKGIPRETLSPETALALRNEGYNLLLTPLRDDALAVWDCADRFGFLVLGGVEREDEATTRRLGDLSCQPSCLGWLAGGEWLRDKTLRRLQALAGAGGALVGVSAASLTAGTVPEGVHFLAGPERDLRPFAASGRPALLLDEPSVEGGTASVFGSIAAPGERGQ